MVRSKIREANAIRVVNVFIYLLSIIVLAMLALLYVTTCK